MALGPVMMSVGGVELDLEEREILSHPTVGGVILFSHNFENLGQLNALVAEIHDLREPRLLVAVDQEGGHVQRFRPGFTSLPTAARIGALYDSSPGQALELADDLGWLLAAELRCQQIDFSFVPVLDVYDPHSKAIGQRAFHRLPATVAELARAMHRGLKAAGMVGVGKHFPGHGSVRADSHVETPTDKRDLETVAQQDLGVFERMIHYGLAAIMTSHLLFPKVDHRLVSCSPVWLRNVLRGRLEFEGTVFSDDLSMAGAETAGDIVDRAAQALKAGTDMILVCNDRAAASRVVDRLEWQADPVASLRLFRMRGSGAWSWAQLEASPRYRRAKQRLHDSEGMTR